MSRLVPILASVVIVLAYGLAEGYWTDRWALSVELEQAPSRLAAIPRDVGEWQGEDQELDPRQARQAELRGSLMRRYSNRRTAEVLNVLLVCGRPGPIAVHSPEVCLGGSGFQLKGKPARREIAATGLPGNDTFWVGNFHKPGAAIVESFEMYWSWNTADHWNAVEKPRLFFAPKRVLYKLYVSRALSRSNRSGAEKEEAAAPEPGPVEEFLRVFLPEVKPVLFPG
jgi:hypothetical protein